MNHCLKLLEFLMNPYQYNHSVSEVKKLIESDRRAEIRLNANGGNSILMVCPPQEELDYIKALRENLEDKKYSIIDLDAVLLEFVELRKSELPILFDLLKGSIEQIFKAPEGEESQDLFGLIISKIQLALAEGKVPVLIKAGALYGSGIDNIHIMEHPVIMDASFPLLVLYPATIEGERLMFLSKRPASKYRCMIVK